MTIQSLFIGVLIVLITAYLCPLVEGYHFEIDFTAIPPSIATMFFFFVVVMLNLLLAKFAKRFRLSKNELMLIYAMTMVGAPLCSLGLVQFLIPNLFAPFHFATPENMWREDFLHYLPKWFGPSDTRVMREFYEGSSHGVPWSAWGLPLLIWCCFALVLYFVLLCICTILRKQWVERERLTFGLLQAPLFLAEESQKGNVLNSLLSNKIMWLGFALPVLVQITVGLHHHFPAFPSFKLMWIRLDPYLTNKPFSAIKPIWISFMYSVIGIAYLVPADVSFSCWFFYLFTKAEDVLAVILGWGASSTTSASLARFPDINDQGVGAFFALCIVGFWTMRKHLWKVLKEAFLPKKANDDSNEPMSYRMAVLGFIFGIAFLLFWLWILGLSPFWGIVLLGIFFVYQIALSRIRAETGLCFIWNPKDINDVLIVPFGTARLGVRNLTAVASVEIFHSHNYLLMPSFLEGYKISDVSKVKGRHLTAAILIGIVLK